MKKFKPQFITEHLDYNFTENLKKHIQIYNC